MKKQSQNKPNWRKAQNERKRLFYKELQKYLPCRAPKNKPKTNPIPKKPRNERKLVFDKGLRESAAGSGGPEASGRSVT
jgi:hypothetical protein